MAIVQVVTDEQLLRTRASILQRAGHVCRTVPTPLLSVAVDESVQLVILCSSLAYSEKLGIVETLRLRSQPPRLNLRVLQNEALLPWATTISVDAGPKGLIEWITRAFARLNLRSADNPNSYSLMCLIWRRVYGIPLSTSSLGVKQKWSRRIGGLAPIRRDYFSICVPCPDPQCRGEICPHDDFRSGARALQRHLAEQYRIRPSSRTV